MGFLVPHPVILGAVESDADNRTVRVERDGEVLTASYLFSPCSGYYNYDGRVTSGVRRIRRLRREPPPPGACGRPRLPGKRVVLIGSGATAVTIPALADSVRSGSHHVERLLTTLVRCPTLTRSRSGDGTKCLPEKLAYVLNPAPSCSSPRSTRCVRVSCAKEARCNMAEPAAARGLRRREAFWTGLITLLGTSDCLAPNGDLFDGQGPMSLLTGHRAVHRDRHQAELRRGNRPPTSSPRPA